MLMFDAIICFPKVHERILLKAIAVAALLLELLGTAKQTGTAGSNETRLLTGDGIASDGRGVTNVLMVSSSVGMVDGVHSNTTSLGPRVALDAVLVVSTTGLQQGLVNTTTSSNDTNGGTSGREDDLLGTGGELDAGLAIIGVVANDGGVTTGGTGESTTVTDGLLNVADNGTLGHGAQRKDVTDVQGSLLTAVDELTSVGTLYRRRRDRATERGYCQRQLNDHAMTIQHCGQGIVATRHSPVAMKVSVRILYLMGTQQRRICQILLCERTTLAYSVVADPREESPWSFDHEQSPEPTVEGRSTSQPMI